MRSRALLSALLAACALLLGACADQARRAQADLQGLIGQLPGHYLQAPGRAVRAVGAVALSVLPVEAPVIGRHVFYVLEAEANNPRLVLAQRIWTLSLSAAGGVQQRSYGFAEPRRWLASAQDPQLLEGLLPGDLSPQSGCPIHWARSGTGFRTPGPAAACRLGRPATPSLLAGGAALSAGALRIGRGGPGSGALHLLRRRKR